MPERIQLSRAKGWRMPPNTVKVDRTTRYGNDFIMAHEGTRADAVASFRAKAIAQHEASPEWYAPLRGKNLACWCPLDKACHADVLLELANAPAGVMVDPEVFPEGSGPFTVERLLELVRTLPPRSMRKERNAYLVEIELIAATLRDGVSGAGHQTKSAHTPMSVPNSQG
jgi:hypothetical protein